MLGQEAGKILKNNSNDDNNNKRQQARESSDAIYSSLLTA